MARNFIDLPSLTNVAKGSKAALAIPRGFTYEVVHFVYSGVTLAQIEDIEVKINGKPIQYFADGKRLQALNKYYKRNTKSGVMSIWFARPEMENNTLRRMTSIGTMDINTFSINFKINAAAAAPDITAHAIRSINTPLGMITKIKDFPNSSATAGLKEIDNIPKEGRIAAIHAFKDDITKIEVTADSNVESEFDKTLLSGVQADYGRVPDNAIHSTVDFTLEGDPSQALVVENVQDLRIRNTLGTSGAFDLVVEYLTGFAGI